MPPIFSVKTVNEQLSHNLNEAMKDLSLTMYQRDFHTRRSNTALAEKYSREINTINDSIEILRINLNELPTACTDHTLVKIPALFDPKPIFPRNYLAV